MRINDDKNLIVGDVLDLCKTNNEEFGKTKIISVKETTFGKLSNEDRDGHEKFNSEEEMYKTYSKYYKTEINSESKLKIIKFELILF